MTNPVQYAIPEASIVLQELRNNPTYRPIAEEVTHMIGGKTLTVRGIHYSVCAYPGDKYPPVVKAIIKISKQVF